MHIRSLVPLWNTRRRKKSRFDHDEMLWTPGGSTEIQTRDHEIRRNLGWVPIRSPERGGRWMSDASRALDLLVGGWQFSGISLFYSGEPVTFTYTPAAAALVSGITQDFRIFTGRTSSAIPSTMRCRGFGSRRLKSTGFVTAPKDVCNGALAMLTRMGFLTTADGAFLRLAERRSGPSFRSQSSRHPLG